MATVLASCSEWHSDLSFAAGHFSELGTDSAVTAAPMGRYVLVMRFFCAEVSCGAIFGLDRSRVLISRPKELLLALWFW